MMALALALALVLALWLYSYPQLPPVIDTRTPPHSPCAGLFSVSLALAWLRRSTPIQALTLALTQTPILTQSPT